MVNESFKKQLWISFGVILASIVATVAILDYFSGIISAKATAIATDRATVQANINTVANLAALQAAVPKADQYQAEIDQSLPDQSELLTFGQWLSGLGEKYNVTTQTAFQGSVIPSAGTTPGSASFTFGAEGSPDGLVALLGDMNGSSSPFPVAITSFSVTANGTNENMTGNGTLFFR